MTMNNIPDESDYRISKEILSQHFEDTVVYTDCVVMPVGLYQCMLRIAAAAAVSEMEVQKEAGATTPKSLLEIEDMFVERHNELVRNNIHGAKSS